MNIYLYVHICIHISIGGEKGTADRELGLDLEGGVGVVLRVLA